MPSKLEFEPELLRRIAHGPSIAPVAVRRKRGRVASIAVRLALALALLVSLSGGAVAAWRLWGPGIGERLAVAAHEAHAILAGADAARAPAGLREEAERMQARARAAGLSFGTAELAAFGGATARVREPRTPPGGGLRTMVGYVYFRDGQHLHAIEIAGREEEGPEGPAFRLTHFWQLESLGNAPLSAAERHARAAFEPLQAASGQRVDGQPRVEQAEFHFIELGNG